MGGFIPATQGSFLPSSHSDDNTFANDIRSSGGVAGRQIAMVQAPPRISPRGQSHTRRFRHGTSRDAALQAASASTGRYARDRIRGLRDCYSYSSEFGSLCQDSRAGVSHVSTFPLRGTSHVVGLIRSCWHADGRAVWRKSGGSLT